MADRAIVMKFGFESRTFLALCCLRIGAREAPCHYCGRQGVSTHLTLTWAKTLEGVMVADELELWVLEEVLRGVMLHGRVLCSEERCWFLLNREQMGNCAKLDPSFGAPVPRFSAVQIAN